MHGWTGDPAADATIARGIRYGQTRRVEVLLAVLMIAVGVPLVVASDTFRLPSYRLVFQFLGAGKTGWLALAVGAGRLWALYLNGRQHMPAWRIAGCTAGFLFWFWWFAALAAIAPPLVPMCPVAFVLMAAEVWASSTAARDAYASNALNLRRGRAGRGRVAQ